MRQAHEHFTNHTVYGLMYGVHGEGSESCLSGAPLPMTPTIALIVASIAKEPVYLTPWCIQRREQVNEPVNQSINPL